MMSRDLKWPEVTRKMSFDRKSSGSNCRRPKTGVYCTFHFLQACSLHEEAVTWQEMTSRDHGWTEVTRNWRHLTESHLEVAVKGRKLTYRVHFTSCNAVAPRRRQSRDSKWRHVTSNDRKWPRRWRHLTGSHLEVAVEGWRLAYTVHFTSYKPVAGTGRQSRDSKWRHVTSNDMKWPGSDVIWQEATWKWL